MIRIGHMVRLNYRGIECPACKRKGLSIAKHPHAIGHKDYSRVNCRFCGKKFDRLRLDALIDAIAKGVKEESIDVKTEL